MGKVGLGEVYKTVLITGATSGIGRATALYLSRRGYRVWGTGRDQDRLRELEALARTESLPLHLWRLDVTDATAISEALPRIIEEAGTLDALVNNAGYGLLGPLEELSLEELRAQFETNLFGVLRMVQGVLPHMRERRGGTIINVGSVSGHISSPGGGAYAASKFALRGLSQGLRMELSQFGINVVLVEPGLIRTNFHTRQTLGQRALDPQSPYYSYAKGIRERSERRQGRAADPITVAKRVQAILGSRRPHFSYTVGMDARAGVLAARWMPEGLLQFFVKRFIAG